MFVDCNVQNTTNMTLKRKKYSNSALSKNSQADIFKFGDLGVIACPMFPWDALVVRSIPSRTLKRF